MGNLTAYLILTLALLFTTLPTKGAFAAIQYQPINIVEHSPIDGVATMYGDVRGRELAPFQVCKDCQCCAANDPKNCKSMPCCFHIDCNRPGKPFGYCSLVPKSCDCTSCS